MKTLLIAALFLMGASAAMAAAPSLTGNWNVHISVAGTDMDLTCAWTQNDTKLTGSCTDPQHTVQVTGSVVDNKFTWTYNSEYNGDPITVTYAATLDGSKHIAGTVDVEPYAVTGDFTATPAPAAAPAAAHDAPAGGA